MIEIFFIQYSEYVRVNKNSIYHAESKSGENCLYWPRYKLRLTPTRAKLRQSKTSRRSAICMPITFPIFASLSVIRSALRFRLISNRRPPPSPLTPRGANFMQLPARLPQVRDRCKKAFAPILLKGISFKTHDNFSDLFLFSVLTLYTFVFTFLYKIFFPSYLILRKICDRQHSCKNKKNYSSIITCIFLIGKNSLNVTNIENKLYSSHIHAIYRPMYNVII